MNLKDKTLLITGIDEFVGLRTAELAIAQGMKVRGITSSTEQNKQLQNLGVEIIIGSITDSTIAQKACQGVDIVLHTESTCRRSWRN